MKEPTFITHVYCVPGMCAKPTIFEHLHLPKDRYCIHWIPWKMPTKKEPIEVYSKRMCTEVKHKNVILIGVSLGGVVIQEMQKFISVKKLILISSVKTKYEIPPIMQWGRRTRLYKLLPAWLAKHFRKMERWPLGKYIKSRLHIYNKFIGVDDKRYIRWAAHEFLYWNRTEPLPGIIHIQGTKDQILPAKYIKNCILVEGGTHLMIINRFRWFNENLPALMTSGKLPSKK